MHATDFYLQHSNSLFPPCGRIIWGLHLIMWYSFWVSRVNCAQRDLCQIVAVSAKDLSFSLLSRWSPKPILLWMKPSAWTSIPLYNEGKTRCSEWFRYQELWKPVNVTPNVWKHTLLICSGLKMQCPPCHHWGSSLLRETLESSEYGTQPLKSWLRSWGPQLFFPGLLWYTGPGRLIRITAAYSLLRWSRNFWNREQHRPCGFVQSIDRGARVRRKMLNAFNSLFCLFLNVVCWLR